MSNSGGGTALVVILGALGLLVGSCTVYTMATYEPLPPLPTPAPYTLPPTPAPTTTPYTPPAPPPATESGPMPDVAPDVNGPDLSCRLLKCRVNW